MTTPEPRVWSSWKGRVIRAIVLDGVYTRNGIREATGLTESQFEIAISEMFEDGLLSRMAGDRYWVNSSELCNEYREFFKKLQASLINWLSRWREREKMGLGSSHFFLEDSRLDELSRKLISRAKVEVLVANPFVERCHLSNTLMDASNKGVRVRLITRPPSLEKSQYQKRKQDYYARLKEKGLSIAYDNAVHTKLIVVDRAVAVVSSMNFHAISSGGASWEAGLVSADETVVLSTVNSILNRLKNLSQ